MTKDYILRAGDLAYCDGYLSGLLPVKVLRLYYSIDEPRTSLVADLHVTGHRKAYRKGEVLQAVPVSKVLHRRQIYTRRGQYWIRGEATHVQSEGMPRHANGTLDLGYTVKTEGTGHRTPMWVARYCSEWIGWTDSKAGAEKLARDHKEELT